MQELSSMNVKLEEKDAHIRELGETIEVNGLYKISNPTTNDRFWPLDSMDRVVTIVGPAINRI